MYKKYEYWCNRKKVKDKWCFHCRDSNDAKQNPSNVRLPPLKKIHKVDKRYEELKAAQRIAPQAQGRHARLPKM